MKKHILLLLALCLLGGVAVAQNKTGKKERKKNLVVKEWNQKEGSGTPYLDNMVTYDDQGRKIEEIEYASYGQKERVVYKYDGEGTKCVEQVEYDHKDKVRRVKKFTYNEDGTKAKQYNYKPNGKLESTKTFEYSYK